MDFSINTSFGQIIQGYLVFNILTGQQEYDIIALR